MIKGIAFDLDGTLIDSAETLTIAWSSTFGEFGLDVKPSEIRKYVGLSPAVIASKFINNLSNDDIEKMKSTRKKYFIENIKRIKVFPDAFSSISKLKEMGIMASIATSMGKDMINEIVEYFKINQLVCCWVSSEEVKNSKPEPDVFLKAFEKMGLSPNACISVGDREYDIIAGKKGGSLTALIVRDEYSKSISVKPDYIIHDLNELLDIVRMVNGIQKSL
ncbi:MAG: HAD family hydrolase [Nitrososphaerota archaeon]|jgi:HAD superfamily hydrolase (TIGR01549 family)|nr:HAD family hydrolase [Nitrososphaerota archaeon]MDG6931927.1 HAD family hydrolase [Nitrososphaerota archaeon]MDG6943870.1 HAD family hydrolase [Nitrososphaerota archaeon]